MVRQLISESELLENHSKEMYQHLRAKLTYEQKVTVRKSQLMSPNFKYLDENLQGDRDGKAMNGFKHII